LALSVANERRSDKLDGFSSVERGLPVCRVFPWHDQHCQQVGSATQRFGWGSMCPNGQTKESLMSKRTRRQFLEDSMLAAASAVTAGSASELLGAELPQSSSAIDKLGVAVVGVRGRGSTHIGAFAGRKDTEVLYVCDVDNDVGQRRVKETAKRQGRAPKFEVDIRRVLEDARVDIVSIATPNHWHALGAIWAMQAGKDVYLEKPVSHNVSEGRRIVETARRYHRICQAGTQCRSNAGMIAAIQYVREGNLGRVNVARGLCYKRRHAAGTLGVYEPPPNIDYDLWLGPAPMSPVTRSRFHYDWHWQWPYGNGTLGNQGVHQMDLARWGLGVSELSRGVISYGHRFGNAAGHDTTSTQTVIHNYGDASLVFEVRGRKSRRHKGVKIGVIFEANDGYLVIASYTKGAAFDREGNKVREFGGGGNHFDNFLRAVRNRSILGLNADIEEGHLSSALCHMGNVSYRLGGPVCAGEMRERLSSLQTAEDAQATFERTLSHLKENGADERTLEFSAGPFLAFDPGREVFLASDEANRMLTREYRQPFVVDRA